MERRQEEQGEQFRRRMEAAQQRVQDAFKKYAKDIESNYMRSFIRDSYACVVDQYDAAGENEPMQVLQGNVEQCQQIYTQAHEFQANEMNRVMQRLQRAGIMCQEEMKREAQATMTEPNFEKEMRIASRYAECVEKAGDTNLEVMRAVGDKIKQGLQALYDQQSGYQNIANNQKK